MKVHHFYSVCTTAFVVWTLVSRWSMAQASASNPLMAGADSATWWSLRPVARVLPPAVEPKGRAWARSPIDSFVLAKLLAKGLEPTPEADRRTLLRRLTFDLHGLPPTPEEMDAFLNDASSDAYEKVVDLLLASSRYGERWARHWMDLGCWGVWDIQIR